MKKIRKGKSAIELCVFVGCFLLVFASLAQIFVFSYRSSKAPTQTSMVTQTKRELPKPTPKPTVPPTKPAEPAPAKVPGAASSKIQARLAARAKAQREIRELERMLARLMRENNKTPQQSLSEFSTKKYERQIKQIIQKVSENGVIPHHVNGTRLRRVQSSQPDQQPDAILNLAGSDGSQDWGGLGAPNLTQDVFHNDNSSRNAVPYQQYNTFNQLVAADSHVVTRLFDIMRKRKSRPMFHKFEEFNNTEAEEMNALLTAEPPSEDEFFREAEEAYKKSLEAAQQGKELHVDEEALEALSGMKVCPKIPDTLIGSISDSVKLDEPIPIDYVLENNTDVVEGGEWKPHDCVSRHKVAIIIPYRDRWSHLKVLLYHLIPILKRQQLHFRIFVVEQYGNETFNKGLIMNSAFREAIKLFDFQCVIFHDVDLVPEDDRNMYSCSEQPKHMSIAIDKFDYLLPYEGLVGGVLNLQTTHFQEVNGYSNMYWGWGAEDDDMTVRIMHKGLRIYRPPAKVGRYKMVKHDQRKTSEASVRLKLLRSAARRSKLEGLNNVRYKLLFVHTEKLFTHFMVDVGTQ